MAWPSRHVLRARPGRVRARAAGSPAGAAFPTDVGAGEAAILDSWQREIRARLPEELRPPPFPVASPGARIGEALERWTVWSPRPLVVFLDEVDALRDATLVSVLRQLRTGYGMRPGSFPHALALIGLRDVKDYRVSSGEREYLGSASPFNIKARSLTLPNFTAHEVAELYAAERAFSLTIGQPWRSRGAPRRSSDDRRVDAR